MDYLHCDYDAQTDYQYKLLIDNRVGMSVYGNLFDVLWLKYNEYIFSNKYSSVIITEIDSNCIEKVLFKWKA